MISIIIEQSQTGRKQKGRVYMRVGMGYDVHKLTEGRKLILGGVDIPWELGLLGHSDADVVVHAIMDALLGAVALRDIGRHFPDTDPQYKGISSILLLQRVGELLEEKGYEIINLDATIIAQRPKLASYRPQMAENIAEALHLDPSRVSVKATTEEGLGFTGSGEGIASQAITLLLGADNKLYYYEGEPNYKDYTSLKETSYGASGLRAVLLQKNAAAVNQVRALKQQKLDLKITDDEYKKKVSEIKSGKNTPTVIIKATDDASYMNLIDALDEMQICNIGKYVITDIAEADEFLIKNYDAKGELSQNLADK